VGPDPRVRHWAVGFSGGEEARYRGRRLAPHAAVRLLRTRGLVPKEDDSWARTRVSDTGLLVSVEVKRRAPAGGGLLLTRRERDSPP
jgi:hypothetical protein